MFWFQGQGCDNLAQASEKSLDPVKWIAILSSKQGVSTLRISQI